LSNKKYELFIGQFFFFMPSQPNDYLLVISTYITLFRQSIQVLFADKLTLFLSGIRKNIHFQ